VKPIYLAHILHFLAFVVILTVIIATSIAVLRTEWIPLINSNSSNAIQIEEFNTNIQGFLKASNFTIIFSTYTAEDICLEFWKEAIILNHVKIKRIWQINKFSRIIISETPEQSKTFSGQNIFEIVFLFDYSYTCIKSGME
jgi:hypothetical protein